MRHSTQRLPLTTTRTRSLVAVAAAVKDAIRYMRSTAPAVQTDNRIRQRAKDLLSSGRAKAVEFLLSICLDAGDRGAMLEAAELPWHVGLAGVRAHFQDEGLNETPATSIAEDHHDEQVAQGEMETAEADWMHDETSPSAALKYLAARGAYVRISSRMEQRALAIAAGAR